MPRSVLNPIDGHVGSRVRMRRLMLKMSQSDLADGLGLTFQQVQKYEKGTNRIGASRLQQISQILQVPVPFFFDRAPGQSGATVEIADSDSYGEWYRQQGTDKFLGSTLEPTLKQAGIKTVIICGNSFQGATVGTTHQAAQRGYKIIVPVDCSAGEDEYHEQYAAFHLAKGSWVGVTSNVTLTRSTMIKF